MEDYIGFFHYFAFKSSLPLPPSSSPQVAVCLFGAGLKGLFVLLCVGNIYLLEALFSGWKNCWRRFDKSEMRKDRAKLPLVAVCLFGAGLKIETDVETQGDFIRFLIAEVENAAFADIEDVVPFVKWLDDELSFLVVERAVLKHFDWLEKKADALREAAFGYCDLKKLESQASSFHDDLQQPSTIALKKMQGLFENYMADSSTECIICQE